MNGSSENSWRDVRAARVARSDSTDVRDGGTRGDRPSMHALPASPQGDHVTHRAQVLAERQKLRAAFLARMPARSLEVMATLSRVRQVYVTSGRDRLLSHVFDLFMEKIHCIEGLERQAFDQSSVDWRDEATEFTTPPRSDRSAPDNDFAPGGSLFVTGASGAGKSLSIRRLLNQHPALQPLERSYGHVRPWVSVSLKGVTTLAVAAKTIIKASGYEIKDTRQSEAWSDLAEILADRGVMLIHLDETQHLARVTGKNQSMKDLADALKGAMNHADWPVSFILSGLPEVNEIARLDEQFERRGEFLHLPDVDPEVDRRLIVKVLNEMAGAASLASGHLAESDVPERLAHAVRCRYGRICQVTFLAIQEALHDDKANGRLTREHFAMTYLRTSHARGRDEMNPFLVDDWRRLEPGSLLVLMDDQEAE